jgi:hypothetical protein
MKWKRASLRFLRGRNKACTEDGQNILFGHFKSASRAHCRNVRRNSGQFTSHPDPLVGFVVRFAAFQASSASGPGCRPSAACRKIASLSSSRLDPNARLERKKREGDLSPVDPTKEMQ